MQRSWVADKRDSAAQLSDLTPTAVSYDLGRIAINSPHQFEDGDSDAESLGSGASNCPTFVSLTAKGKDPELIEHKGSCRFRLGLCTTPRGTCGNSADSGMKFEGKVTTATDCTGTLALMQNVLSTNRRVTKADGTKECLTATAAHHDGGPPWKGCSVAVTAAGTHTIESDDCPGRKLDDNPQAVSMTDNFKMYLMWKATGEKSWKPIANVTWGWAGSIKRKAGAKDSDSCTARYTINSKSHTDGTGKASKEMPVASPRIRDVKPGACSGNGAEKKSESAE